MTLRSLLLPLILLTTSAAHPQAYSADRPVGATPQQLPAYLAHAGIEQRLGQPLPLATVFTDQNDHTAPLSTWLNSKPTILALVYYRCQMLCPQVLQGLANGLRSTTLTLGKDYNVVVFSIDPVDTPLDAAREQHDFLTSLGPVGSNQAANPAAAASVHFLTGTPASIAAITGATGFHYVLVPGPDGKMDQFAHSSVIIFATPDGHLSKYLSGIDYPARDLRLALLDASAHHISNPVDLLILYCCSYNPVVGKYSVSVLRILGIAGMIAMFMVIGVLYLLTRKPSSQMTA